MSDDGFVTDTEMLNRLNLPQKVGMSAIDVLDRMDPTFPKRDDFFGGRRFMPAVWAWFFARYNVKPGATPTAVDGPENFDRVRTPRRKSLD